jgi:hypothetical protein
MWVINTTSRISNLTITTNIKKIKVTIKTFIIINRVCHLKTEVEENHDTSWISNLPQIIDSVQYNVSTMSQPLSQTFRESIYTFKPVTQTTYIVKKKTIYQGWPTTRATGATSEFTLWPSATGFGSGRPVVALCSLMFQITNYQI